MKLLFKELVSILDDFSFLKDKHLNQVTRLSRLIAEINTKEILMDMAEKLKKESPNIF